MYFNYSHTFSGILIKRLALLSLVSSISIAVGMDKEGSGIVGIDMGDYKIFHPLGFDKDQQRVVFGYNLEIPAGAKMDQKERTPTSMESFQHGIVRGELYIFGEVGFEELKIYASGTLYLAKGCEIFVENLILEAGSTVYIDTLANIEIKGLVKLINEQDKIIKSGKISNPLQLQYFLRNI